MEYQNGEIGHMGVPYLVSQVFFLPSRRCLAILKLCGTFSAVIDR